MPTSPVASTYWAVAYGSQIRSSDESYNDERADELWNGSLALTARPR